jgi:hypothetical protein
MRYAEYEIIFRSFDFEGIYESNSSRLFPILVELDQICRLNYAE